VDTLEFLKLVWPDQGHYLILIPTQYVDRNTQQLKQSYKHFAFATIDAAAEHALAIANDRETPHNVFFALGTVKEDLTRTPKVQRDAAGKKVRGMHKSGFDNTCLIKSYWLDLDVDMTKASTGHAYATREDAATGIRNFCAAMGLPRPYITSSGGGLHVYWPLTEAIDPDKWQHYANILKQLTESWGLRADPARTADRASILRPVGTHNWKTGAARTVHVVVQGVVNDTNQFLNKLAYLAETANLPPVQQHRHAMQLGGTPPTVPGMQLGGTPPTVPGMQLAGAAPVGGIDVAAMNDAAAAGAGYEQADAREVVGKCSQLRWQATNQSLVPEPLWYAMIGCLRHAKDGVKAIHFMSRQGATYSPANTDMKIQQHMDGGFGPTLCSKFEQHNPAGCQGCPYKGKIKTPLQTVRKLEQVAAPILHLQQATGASLQIALPPPPKPFKRVTNPLTGTARIAMTIGDAKTGDEEDVVIYEYDVFPSRLIFDERESRYNVAISRWLPQDGWAEFEVPTGKLYDKKQLAMTFGDIGVMPDLGMVEELVSYMIGYIRDLQKAAASSTIYAQLGWRHDMARFVMPDRVVTAAGAELITPSKNITNTLSWMEPRGDLEEWKKIAAIYERPGMEAHQFGFGVGFASPLFVHTNFKGMVVSMVGERGAGKSSAAMLANSIWGHPEMGWADLQMDTIRAFYQKLGVLKNLPATYDEHTNLDGEVVSDLCYTVSKGQGRQRLKTNGEAQENYGNFQLMMLMTGNKSLNERLAMYKSDASAEAARVFEYFVPANTMTKAEADLYFGPDPLIKQHFGLAGQVYAQAMIQSVDWTRDRIKHWVRTIDQMAKVSSGERFWSAGAACVLAGFELANQCGLTNVDIDRLLQFSVKTIVDMRISVVEHVRSPVAAISDYFNSNLRSSLVLGSDPTATSPAIMLHEPSDKLRIRYEKHNGKLYIDRADFRRFCGVANVDSAAIAKELSSLGVLKAKDLKITLGKGTTYSGMQTICWVIDMNHPSVKGAGELVSIPSQPVAGVQACV
jgi:hypothetical protein